MRRRKAAERQLAPDPKFKNRLVANLINIVMREGKKSLAERVVYKSLDIAKDKAGEQDPIKVLNKAVDNARPRLEVKPRRVGGATYQIPIDVKEARGVSIALRWIRDFARAKKGRPMEERLAEEIIAAYKNEGSSIKKRDDTHKMAESNKAFAHFRW